MSPLVAGSNLTLDCFSPNKLITQSAFLLQVQIPPKAPKTPFFFVRCDVTFKPRVVSLYSLSRHLSRAISSDILFAAFSRRLSATSESSVSVEKWISM